MRGPRSRNAGSSCSSPVARRLQRSLGMWRRCGLFEEPAPRGDCGDFLDNARPDPGAIAAHAGTRENVGMRFGVTSKLFLAVLLTNIVTALAVGFGVRAAF